jgi:serine palmitoyltransferase
LNASGYVFSASSPPYLVSSATKAISLIQEKPELLKQLRNNIAVFRKGIEGTTRLHRFVSTNNAHTDGFILSTGIQESGITVSTLVEAPIVHLKLAESSGDRFEDEKTLQAIVDEALEQGTVSLLACFLFCANRPPTLTLLLLRFRSLCCTGVLLTRAQYVHTEKFLPQPSIRVAICSTHEEKDVAKVAKVVKEAAQKVLSSKH